MRDRVGVSPVWLALFGYPILLIAYLTIALQQALVPSLLVALCLASAAIPLLLVAATPDQRCRPSYVIIYTAVGMAAAGVLALVARAAFGLPLLGIPLYGLGIGMIALAVPKRRTHAFPDTPVSPATWWLSLTLAIVAALPTLLYAMAMGRGEFPEVFYNVDNPYHLSQVWGLLRDSAHPPASLAVAGVRRYYQYGGQEAAALLTQWSGVPPHTALLGILYPLYAVGTVAACWRFAALLESTVPRWLSLGALALVTADRLDFRELYAIVDIVRGDAHRLVGADLYEVGHSLDQFAIFVAVLLATWFQRRGRSGLTVPAFAALTALALIRMPSWLGLMMSLGLYCLILCARQRSLRPLRLIAFVAACSAAMTMMLGWNGGGTAGDFAFRPLRHVQMAVGAWYGSVGSAGLVDGTWARLGARLSATAAWLWEYHWAIVGGPVMIWLFSRTPRRRWITWSLIILGPVILINSIIFTRGALDIAISSTRLFSAFRLVPFLLTAACLTLWARSSEASTSGRLLRALFSVYVGALALANVSAAVAIAAVPSAGYEWVDNRSIAAALRAIPAEHTIIVTNDLRYPANGRTRAEQQWQVPAVFGHTAYMVDGVNDLFPGTGARLALQERLRDPVWDPAILDVARREGWTHFLVNHTRPHAGDLPLRKIFENTIYRVYEFPQPAEPPSVG